MSKRKITNVIATALAVVIAITFIVIVPSCKKEETLSQTAESFIHLVLRIKTPITLDSAAEIEAGYVLYDYMDDKDKEDVTVKESKATLDGYKSEYDVLRAEQDIKDENDRQAALRERFEYAVESLPVKLTSGNRADVEAAFELYEQLNEQSREVYSVKIAYASLVAAESKIAEIEREEHLAEIAAIAQQFIDGVNQLYGEDGDEEITLDSIDAIEDLLYDYGKFTDEVKEIDGVEQAKEKLDGALAEYQELKDEADVKQIKKYAKELSPLENVSLESKMTILNAEKLYEDMSEKAKQVEGVAEAYEVIAAAREKYDALFAVAEAERIQIFIEAANRVPTDIQNVDIDWFDVLDAAADAY